MGLYGNFPYIQECMQKILPMMQDGDWLRLHPVEHSKFLWSIKLISPNAVKPGHTYEQETVPAYDPCNTCDFVSFCDGPPCDHYATEMKRYERRIKEAQS